MTSVHSTSLSPLAQEGMGAAGFQRVGWQGFSLLVPDTWNLQLHDGDARSGAMLFADLRATRLEVRWQTARRFPGFPVADPARRLAKMLRRLRKRYPEAVVQELSPTAVRVTQADGILLLASSGKRRYELHWPGPVDDSREQITDIITRDFLVHLAANDERPEYFWSIYGAAGWIRKGARLRKASLLPGATTLSFQDKSGTIVLGAFSMADRLLGASLLREWAGRTIALIGQNPGGRWKESVDQATFVADCRRVFRHFRHTLIFRHDRAGNRIVWSHHFGPLRR